jgi:cysteine-rich repeat protein
LLISDCGDGVLDVGEECDNGNQDPGDGSSAKIASTLPKWFTPPPEPASSEPTEKPGDGSSCDDDDVQPKIDLSFSYDDNDSNKKSISSFPSWKLHKSKRNRLVRALMPH